MPVRRTESGQLSRNTISLLVSVNAHIALLLLLACMAYAVGKRSMGIVMYAAIDESNETANLTVLSTDVQAPTSSPWDGPDNHLSSGKIGLGIARSLVTSGKKERRGTKAGANFFGTEAPGESFVFIIDRSGSMNGKRWEYAREELIYSLRRMPAGQRFFILCFASETNIMMDTPADQARYFTASDHAIEDVKYWLEDMKPRGGTKPLNSLRLAIDFKPDAVFFLSDGEIGKQPLDMLRRINRDSKTNEKIPIHTVHLLSIGGADNLEQLAKENNGKFRSISVWSKLLPSFTSK